MLESATPLSDDALQQLLEGSVKSVAEKLVTLNPAELQRLEELERNGKCRAGVLNAIEDTFLSKDESPAPAAPPAAPTAKEPAPAPAVTLRDVPVSPKVARGETPVPAYCRPDYNGPMTIDQALKRNAYLDAQRAEKASTRTK